MYPGNTRKLLASQLPFIPLVSKSWPEDVDGAILEEVGGFSSLRRGYILSRLGHLFGWDGNPLSFHLVSHGTAVWFWAAFPQTTLPAP